jgi:Tfp pilus assembly protein PilX
MNRRNEDGVALIITMFLMAALSALAVSLMFLSQTETSASRNYKTMSQARYAGEAGLHKALNYLMSNTYTVTVPTAYASLNTATYPVQYSSADVTLKDVATSSNYPDSTVKSQFAALFSGTAGQLTAGTATLTYTANAKLLSVEPLNVYGGSTAYIQTWQVTATGTVPGVTASAPAATVEVTAIVERDSVPAQTYAIFATGTGCGAINLGGTTHTDSYNSTTMTTTPPTTVASGGGVGTNGNLAISGHVRVNGNLDTPRTGVGACTDGTPTALTEGGSADVSGSIVPLSQAKVYPDPTPPASPFLPLNAPEPVPALATGCATILAGNAGAACSYDSSSKTFTVISNGATPLVFNDLSLGSHVQLTVEYGVGGSPATGTVSMNVNSLVLGAQAQVNIGPNTGVTMNVLGSGVTTPVDLSGGAFANPSYDPSKFQILYAGTGHLEMIGGNGAAVSVYAPNAAVRLNGNADLYGSVLCNTYTNGGDGSVHYDTALSTKFITLGNFLLSSFSWKKY